MSTAAAGLLLLLVRPAGSMQWILGSHAAGCHGREGLMLGREAGKCLFTRPGNSTTGAT